MSTDLHLSFHETPEDMYAALRRVFIEQDHDGTRWVSVNVDGVRLTFFACAQPAEAQLPDIEQVLA